MTNPPNHIETPLSPGDRAVLRVFREFLMTTGQMLCFYGQDLDRHRARLRDLTERGLLTAERFPGGYSLTSSGFAAMRSVSRSRQ